MRFPYVDAYETQDLASLPVAGGNRFINILSTAYQECQPGQRDIGSEEKTSKKEMPQ